MGPRRRLIAAVVLAVVAAAGWLAVPRSFVVEGVSMGPALLPGDVVRTTLFPALDRLRQPRRFERWVLQATDGLALKRVVGLPGEEVSIAGGDLAIDGDVVLKSPRLLAEMGSVVADKPSAGDVSAADGWAWSRPGGEVPAAVGFDEESSHPPAVVRDVGLAAVVDVREASAHQPATVRIRVGDSIVEPSLVAPGRHAVVGGRLDGRLVVAVWRVPIAAVPAGARSCLPAGAPHGWSDADSWPRTVSGADLAPSLAIGSGKDGRASVIAVHRWRDVAYLPGADGRASWRLGAHEILVFGDHPPASIDSRFWGPVKASALRDRIAAHAVP